MWAIIMDRWDASKKQGMNAKLLYFVFVRVAAAAAGTNIKVLYFQLGGCMRCSYKCKTKVKSSEKRKVYHLATLFVCFRCCGYLTRR
jgi:hypothetical protein